MPHQTHTKGTILVVDDNPVNLDVLFDHLHDAGLEILVAEDGLEGIERAKRTQPHLILLDIMMPGIDGFETCRRLKNDEATSSIPIIFMTALTDIRSKVKGFEAGAVDYITKPFQREEVLARVKTHIILRNTQRMLEAHNAELQEALAQVEQLSGLLPICANCKNIRDDEGYWHDVAVYIRDHSEVEFTHGICPDCMQKLYPDFV